MLTEKPRILNDYIFKKIFSKKGNESILRDFLIAILATLDDKTIVNIEVQIINHIRL